MAANSPNPDSTDEKATVSASDLPSTTKKGFFSRKANKPDSNALDEKSNDAVLDGPASTPAKQIRPASFASLFRSLSSSLHPFRPSHLPPPF